MDIIHRNYNPTIPLQDIYPLSDRAKDLSALLYPLYDLAFSFQQYI